MTRRGWLLFAAMGIIWGIPYLLIRVAVRSVSPVDVVFARTALAALILTPLAARRGMLRPLLPAWRPLLAYTVVEIAVPWVLLSDAETKLSSSLSGLLVAAVPLIGAVLARVTGSRDRIDGRRLTGLLVGFGGVAALLGLDVGARNTGAVVEVLVVAVGYAAGPLILARRLSDLPGMGVVAASLLICAVGYLPAALVELPSRVPPARSIAALVTLGLVCTSLAFLLFFDLIREVGPVRATVITYVNPAVAVVLGVGLLGEKFGVGTALGFALILVGSVLATRGGRASAGRDSAILAGDVNQASAGAPERVLPP